MAWNAILEKKLIFYKSIMTMFRKIVTICLVAFLYVPADAQDFYDEFRAKSIDVEGMKIGHKMTYDQFVAKFGIPDRYEQNELGDPGSPCLDEYYWVGKNFLSFTENGTFCEFFLRDDRFSALTLWISGGIRVGDKLSKLYTILLRCRMTKRRDILRKVLVICLLALPAVTMIAQDFYDEFRAKSIDVEGVKTGQKMTYDQFVTKFGKPTEYIQSDSDSGEEGTPTTDEYYRVGKDVFYFRNNGSFCGFSIKDKKLSVLTLWIDGGIHVGDKLSSLDNFKYGKPKVASWLEPKDGVVKYTLFYNYLDGLVFLSVKNGIICSISYSDPI